MRGVDALALRARVCTNIDSQEGLRSGSSSAHRNQYSSEPETQRQSQRRHATSEHQGTPNSKDALAMTAGVAAKATSRMPAKATSRMESTAGMESTTGMESTAGMEAAAMHGKRAR